ncbi:MAG: NAD(P)-binding oxidoreductase [Verrucomicrobiota bacterium]
MLTLIIGASGATGQRLVSELLRRGEPVKAVVRSTEKLPESFEDNPNLALIEASVLELTDEEMAEHVRDCSAVVSCLGHNLSFRGIFGPPHRLVTEATRRWCAVLKANGSHEPSGEASEFPSKFILMNTTGNRNRDLDEPISFIQHCMIGLLRAFLPPHADNEAAADYLRTEIGQNDMEVEWVVVRPDSLTEEENVTDYDLHSSPLRSAIFDSGKTSRINVAHFMAELITDPTSWDRWKGQMPVIYNRE